MFEFEIQSQDAVLSLATAHHAPHVKGRAAGAYAGILNIGASRIQIWGMFGVKSPEILYVYGLSRALDEASAILTSDSFSITVWVPTDGFKLNLMKHTPIWIRNGGKTTTGNIPEGYEDYKRCYLMTIANRIVLQRVTPRYWGLDRLGQEAKRIAALAFEKRAYEAVGLTVEGLGFENAR